MIIVINFVIFKFNVPDISLIEYEPTWVWNFRAGITPPNELYCNATVSRGIDMNTADFAILTTLPRLYAVHDGKCYIKPRLRGVFNTTMKYIFGEDYHNQGIQIFCYPSEYNIYLSITKTEFLDAIVNEFKADKRDGYIEWYDDYQVGITTSQEYDFGSIESLCDNIDEDEKEICQKLQNCINDNNYNNCNEEWSNYTNRYWRRFNDSYQELKGLEQYENTIDENTVFKPAFRDTDKNVDYNAYHLIVGGGWENQWGIAVIAENYLRFFIPDFFGSLIPLYSYVASWARGLFLIFMDFSVNFIFVENLMKQVINEYSDLLTRYNFTTRQLYQIGHSTSASIMKELSYTNSIRGTVFEGTPGFGYGLLQTSDDYYYKFIYGFDIYQTNNMNNIFSGSYVFKGFDSDFSNNGKLPDRYYIPNVFDTACITVAKCTSSGKYIGMCNYVLSEDPYESEKQFNELIAASSKSGQMIELGWRV